MKISNFANIILLAFKVSTSIKTVSIASKVDLVLDLMAFGILSFYFLCFCRKRCRQITVLQMVPLQSKYTYISQFLADLCSLNQRGHASLDECPRQTYGWLQVLDYLGCGPPSCRQGGTRLVGVLIGLSLFHVDFACL